ncbi:glutaredoxin family protein [Salinispira pacifica]|uniref:Glutaredoxin domain-containing protein n=1 Tax=Salinispira pacifica TaxID=1307761 RepID=V5WKG2_9SPIO|nr:glutaredoxin family protein [Salinispira pacifica]AHC16317.1 hypothetical protein L21SP2_2971 [Salinispira pacifica]
MSYIESVDYKKVEGSKTKPALRVYALSTCAFCEKAMNFLKEHEYAYEYLFMDLIDREVKKSIKAELKEKHGSIPLFPLLVVDGEQAVSGFTEEKWRELLDIE